MEYSLANTISCWATCCALLLSTNLSAMNFNQEGSKQACRDPDACEAWIQADGLITSETPAQFIAYLKSNPYSPRVIRFNSPGGDLNAGITLGQMLRKRGFATEADICVSACTYAFLGGERRSLAGSSSKIGVHRFYQKSAVMKPSARQYTGEDLDDTQRILAGLMLYTLEMGADLRLIALTGEAGPNEMRWLSQQEALDLNVIFEPNKWLPWTIEGGFGNDPLLAVSQTQDGKKSMQLGCTHEGPFLTLTDDDQDTAWFQQCTSGSEGAYHPILGLRSPMNSVRVIPWHETGGAIMFFLPRGDMDFSKPSLFSDMGNYPMSCIDMTSIYAGTSTRMQIMAETVLSSCNTQL